LALALALALAAAAAAAAAAARFDSIRFDSIRFDSMWRGDVLAIRCGAAARCDSMQRGAATWPAFS